MKPRLNAVGVTTSDLARTVEFYRLLGFEFPEYKEDEGHIEARTSDGSARLMIDTKQIVKDIIGEDPKPGNHSSFAVEYASPQEVNLVAKGVKEAGFLVSKEPWDAFWGQRYAIVEDPDGYKVEFIRCSVTRSPVSHGKNWTDSATSSRVFPGQKA
jgi:catechol 2,3-dioxygenase-like lactoylglutathione lyase family enzyme